MISLRITTPTIWMMLMTTTTTLAFTIHPAPTKPHLPLYMIDKNTANMIDQEYYRQHHKEEYHQQWMVQNQQQVKQTSKTTNIDDVVGVMDTYNIENDDNDMLLNRRQLLRDEKLARTNPQQYCMDRCIATGYCDVYEDYFDFTPEQVVEFCTDCVMASKDECTIPDAFYDHMNDLSPPPPNTFLP